ncbi:MAG: hypothetical protein GX446_06400 [Chthonomonadales bacterium]|nr:hypothetical protein [Chthonomonadales bacterium]
MSVPTADSYDGRSRVSGKRFVTWMLVVLGIGALASYAYWRFVFYPTTPQYALGVFLDAVIERDYATAYSRLYVTAPVKLVIPTAKALEQIGENAGGIIPRLKQYRLGKTVRTEEGATVETILIAAVGDEGTGAPRTEATDVTVEMRRDEGRWKVDAGWALREAVKRGGAELLRSLFQ